MAEAKKAKRQYFNSEEGRGRYVHAHKPDTKFKAEGEYKVDLIVGSDYATRLTAQLQAIADAKVEEVLAEMKPADKARIMKDGGISVHLPIVEDFDDEGKETGKFIVNFRQNATITFKDGETKEVAILIYNRRGKPDEKVKAYGGSLLVVNFSPRPYYNAKDKEVGVRLDFSAVQVLEEAQSSGGGGGNMFKDHGGDDEDDTPSFSNHDAGSSDNDVSDEDLGKLGF